MYPPSTGSFANYSTTNPILIKGAYLIRSVQISGSTLEITGDLNSTASFEIIAPAAYSKQVTFNGEPLTLATTSYGTLTSSKSVSLPSVPLPDLERLTWVSAYNFPRWLQPTPLQENRRLTPRNWSDLCRHAVDDCQSQHHRQPHSAQHTCCPLRRRLWIPYRQHPLARSLQVHRLRNWVHTRCTRRKRIQLLRMARSDLLRLLGWRCHAKAP